MTNEYVSALLGLLVGIRIISNTTESKEKCVDALSITVFILHTKQQLVQIEKSNAHIQTVQCVHTHAVLGHSLTVHRECHVQRAVWRSRLRFWDCVFGATSAGIVLGSGRSRWCDEGVPG